MKNILFWPYQIYVWLLFLPFALAFTFFSGWMTVLVAWLVSPRIASRHVASNWARVLAWLTPIRVVIEGRQHIDPTRDYVVVANHQSQYDILMLYGFLRLDLKWVMKQELRKIPGVGIGCEKAGHIFVDRSNPEAAQAAINAALAKLEDGVGILFFPEGTRSADGQLLPFKSGAFRVAAGLGLPLLPVTLIGTREILPARTLKLFPGTARMVVHPPIEAAGKDPRELLREARYVIASALPGAVETA